MLLALFALDFFHLDYLDLDLPPLFRKVALRDFQLCPFSALHPYLLVLAPSSSEFSASFAAAVAAFFPPTC